jgi:hypothetical protein
MCMPVSRPQRPSNSADQTTPSASAATKTSTSTSITVLNAAFRDVPIVKSRRFRCDRPVTLCPIVQFDVAETCRRWRLIVLQKGNSCCYCWQVFRLRLLGYPLGGSEEKFVVIAGIFFSNICLRYPRIHCYFGGHGLGAQKIISYFVFTPDQNQLLRHLFTPEHFDITLYL